MKQPHMNSHRSHYLTQTGPSKGGSTNIESRVGRFVSMLGLMLLIAVSGHVPTEASQSGAMSEEDAGVSVEIDFAGENVEQLVDGRWIRSTAYYRGQTFVLVDRSPTVPEQPRGGQIRIFLLSKHKADGSLRGKTWAYINGHKYIATDKAAQSASSGSNQRG